MTGASGFRTPTLFRRNKLFKVLVCTLLHKRTSVDARTYTDTPAECSPVPAAVIRSIRYPPFRTYRLGAKFSVELAIGLNTSQERGLQSLRDGSAFGARSSSSCITDCNTPANLLQCPAHGHADDGAFQLEGADAPSMAGLDYPAFFLHTYIHRRETDQRLFALRPEAPCPLHLPHTADDLLQMWPGHLNNIHHTHVHHPPPPPIPRGPSAQRTDL